MLIVVPQCKFLFQKIYGVHTKAAVAVAAGKPLEIMEVNLKGHVQDKS